MLNARRSGLLLAGLILLTACQGGGTPGAGGTGAGSPAGTAAAGGDDLLAEIQERGVLRVSTDPNYAPQSFLTPEGEFVGFDIDVATEIANRLGVDVAFETPSFDAVVAGGWAGRWDVSVGSITVTEERQAVLDFTEPYYFTPAQMAATVASGITTLEQLAGRRVCVGASTTYLLWLQGTLELPDGADITPPPENIEPVTLETDQLCAQTIASGRTDFEGFLSSSTTIAAAMSAGTPIVLVGNPVFYEPLAVATDKAGPPHDELQAELDRIVREMHEDGTLSRLSETWFCSSPDDEPPCDEGQGLDLTTRE